MFRLFWKTTGAAAILLISAQGGNASPIGPNLVANGDFDQVTMPNGPQEMTGANVAGWSSGGYNFIFFPGTQTSGSFAPEYGANVSFWNPGNGANNGFTDTSPTGGNYLAADGAFRTGAITQTLHGLNIGSEYAVSFDWAAAQQYTYTGATTEQWIVSLGGQSASTVAYQLPSHGFSGWMEQTFNFKATSADEVLSFLANGTPNGEPPFSLLDGITANEILVPEPAAWLLLLAGVACLAALRASPRNRLTV